MNFPIQSEFNRPKWDRGGAAEQLPQMFIPWGMVISHEAQCQTNHRQTLKRISERGGFSRSEAIAIIEDRQWTPMSCEDADIKLKEMVRVWELKNEQKS